ncbi:unnamed protein product [Protopolystoma xenopodis]|uniref:Uncharacterized protein n=1 Tax=Protopolystoma xenopodis TaxID=117903 RepID=A0A3S5CQH4_9PLAT|nr:unnamed protein product [Protopolystoma xenopodis]
MAKLTEAAGETFENVPSPLSDAGKHDNYYVRRLRTSMVSCFDDVRRMTDESSASIHRDREALRRGSIRTNLQPQLQDNQSTACGGNNLRIPSTRLFKRNERYSKIDLLRDSSRPSFSAYQTRCLVV